ncbi:MAG: 50S ribosomal protein L33 [Candidatus Paceibacterota bacterium]
MAKSKFRENLIGLQCTECKRRNYYTSRNKKSEGKLAVKKHCPWCRIHTNHKQVKV